jgi:hypothetical protein
MCELPSFVLASPMYSLPCVHAMRCRAASLARNEACVCFAETGRKYNMARLAVLSPIWRFHRKHYQSRHALLAIGIRSVRKQTPALFSWGRLTALQRNAGMHVFRRSSASCCTPAYWPPAACEPRGLRPRWLLICGGASELQLQLLAYAFAWLVKLLNSSSGSDLDVMLGISSCPQ